MATTPTEKVGRALWAVVTRRRNQLRRLPLDELRRLPPLQLARVTFGEAVICVAITADPAPDGGVAVLVRGHLAPYRATRMRWYRGFFKCPDGSWTERGDEKEFDALRARLALDALLV